MTFVRLVIFFELWFLYLLKKTSFFLSVLSTHFFESLNKLIFIIQTYKAKDGLCSSGIYILLIVFQKLLPIFLSNFTPLGLLKGRWAWMVGSFFFFYPRTSQCPVYLPSIFSLTFSVPSCLFLSCFLAPWPSRLLGDLFCFLLCFFFCFECLSLQISGAG